MPLIHSNRSEGVRKHLISNGEFGPEVLTLPGVTGSPVCKIRVENDVASVHFRQSFPDLRIRVLRGSPEQTISAVGDTVVGMIAIRMGHKVMIGNDVFAITKT